MRAAIILLCLSAPVFAQQKSGLGRQPGQNRLASACGSQETSYKVKLDRSQHGPLPPQAGKALVYFIHDDGSGVGGAGLASPTIRYAVDGAWVGANHGESWFAVAVTPGERHFCSAIQSALLDERVELAHITAEAGKSYYFRTQLLTSRSIELLELQQIDSDEAGYLYSEYPMATATAKK
jgi:hypothetical protein